ncbi:hypothetical protein HYV72_00705 [Candidatus Uhrbacteria bacterium]|nr:hypothetical protein [Candidatus Uhrbacteria bacterium]
MYCFVESRASSEHCGSLHEDGEAAMKRFEAIPQWLNDAGVRDIYETDMRALRASHTLVLLLPAGVSSHMEAGIAWGMGKNVVLIGKPEKTESLYHIFQETYDDVDVFIGSLQNDAVRRQQVVSSV